MHHLNFIKNFNRYVYMLICNFLKYVYHFIKKILKYVFFVIIIFLNVTSRLLLLFMQKPILENVADEHVDISAKVFNEV